MAETISIYRGLAGYLGQLVDLSKGDKKLNTEIKELQKNMPVDAEGASIAKGMSKAKQLENIIQCLEAASALVTDHNRQKWFSKVIKKRKKVKSVDLNIDHFGKDLLNALNIVHVIILSATQPASDTTDRTVLWVDDHPENNTDDVSKAKKEYHVSVTQKKSTQEAMEYVKGKADKFKKAASSQFRIVTDFHRDDEGDQAAGNLIKALRKDGWECPVLIYCSEKAHVMDLLAENRNVTVATSDTLLYLYFDSMSYVGEKKEKKEDKSDEEQKDEVSDEHTDEMPKSEEEPKQSNLKGSKGVKKSGSNVSAKSAKSAKADSDDEKESPPPKSVKKSSSNLSSTSNKSAKSAKSGTTAKAESDEEGSSEEKETPPKKDIKKSGSNLSSSSNKSLKSKITKDASEEEIEPETETKPIKKSTSNVSNKSNKLAEESDEEAQPVKKSLSNVSNNAKKDEDTKPAEKKTDLKSSTGSVGAKSQTATNKDEGKTKSEAKTESPKLETKASKPELLKKTASGLSAGKGNKIGDEDEDDEKSPLSSPLSTKKSSLINPNLKKLVNNNNNASADKNKESPKAKLERDESASYTSRPEAVNSILKLESDAHVGHVCVFSVQVKDQFNTNFKEGGDFVAADFKGPVHFEGYVEDNNDGTYKISCFPTRTGSYKAYVTVNGSDVKNSPFSFVAKEAPKKTDAKPLSPEPLNNGPKKRKLDEMDTDKQEEPAAKKTKLAAPSTAVSTTNIKATKAQEDAKLMPPPKAVATPAASKKKEHSDEEKSDDDTYWLMNSDDSPKKKVNQNSSVDSSVDRSVDAHNSSHEKETWEDDTCMEPTLRLDDEDAFPVPPPQARGYDDHDIEPTLRLDDEDFALPKQNMDIDDSAPTQLLM